MLAVSVYLLLVVFIDATVSQTTMPTYAECPSVNPGYIVDDNHVTLSAGCYHSMGSHRVFPAVNRVNFRGEIDWDLWEAAGSAEQIIVKCAKTALDRRFYSFGVEFYGECDMGDTPDLTQGKVTPADGCQKCSYDVGGANAAVVYHIFRWYTE
ncbi:hypothetical protein PoB_005308800 [Plakobranchus ocellatus]|uniref:Uncharacterized protein n=1 Tax=Plakobranchus ocellatus TaxID=259542 RepID=A0AAV4C592_9GAST|nr:hypothetical protein PoB_005308800 [Plakobranchus ocellatus]